MKKTLLSIFIYAITIAINPSLSLGQTDPYVEAKINSILALMTLEEKVKMCHAQSTLKLWVSIFSITFVTYRYLL